MRKERNTPASANTKNGGRAFSADLCTYELQASNRQNTKRKTTEHRSTGGNPVTVIDPSNGEIYSIRYYKRKRRERREDEEGEDQ